MKTVCILTGLGLLTLGLFACGGATRAVEPPPPKVEAPVRVVEVLPILPAQEAPVLGIEAAFVQSEGRLEPEAVRQSIQKDQVPALEYTNYSRAGHKFKVKKQSPGIN